jgi:hypothetical protein
MATTLGLLRQLRRRDGYFRSLERLVRLAADTPPAPSPALDWAHRLLADGARQGLYDNPDKAHRFLGLIGLEADPYALRALWEVLGKSRRWREIGDGGLLAYLSDTVLKETKRIRADQEQADRLQGSVETETNRARDLFVTAAGGRETLEAWAAERGISVRRLLDARTLAIVRREAREINREAGRPDDYGLPPAESRTTLRPQMAAHRENPRYDPEDDPIVSTSRSGRALSEAGWLKSATKAIEVQRAAAAEETPRGWRGSAEPGRDARLTALVGMALPSQQADILRLVLEDGLDPDEAIERVAKGAGVTAAKLKSELRSVGAKVLRASRREYGPADLKREFRRRRISQDTLAGLCGWTRKTVNEDLGGSGSLPDSRYAKYLEILQATDSESEM